MGRPAPPRGRKPRTRAKREAGADEGTAPRGEEVGGLLGASARRGSAGLTDADLTGFLGALDRRARAEEPCHTALPGEECYTHVLWAKEHGAPKDRDPGLQNAIDGGVHCEIRME